MDFLVYYDKDCTFCKKWTHRLFNLFGFSTSCLKPSGNETEVDHLMELHNSWVLKLEDNYYYKYEAFLKLVEISKFEYLLFIFNNPISTRIGEHIYKRVSSSRSCK